MISLLLSLALHSIAFAGSCCPSGSTCSPVVPLCSGAVRGPNAGATSASATEVQALRQAGQGISWFDLMKLAGGTYTFFKGARNGEEFLSIWVNENGDITYQKETQLNEPHRTYLRQLSPADAARFQSSVRGFLRNRREQQSGHCQKPTSELALWETGYFSERDTGKKIEFYQSGNCHTKNVSPAAVEVQQFLDQLFETVKNEVGRSSLSSRAPE